MKSVYILGRQPAIGLAELESLYGANNVAPVGSIAALVSEDTPLVPFARIGSSIKECLQIAAYSNTSFDSAINQLQGDISKQLRNIPDGKLKFGLSVYGQNISPKKINAAALSLKKSIKKSGRSVRVVPNKATELNAAQILNNKLTDKLGMELNLIFYNNELLVTRTTAVQDIDAYAARDHGRPKRDAKVGMLPPKLAQTMINLVVGKTSDPANTTVLDPFCGTGVVLQESLLMGFAAYGTDIDERMIEYTNHNLNWLIDAFSPPNTSWHTEVGDATQHEWQQGFNVITCETYLGRPFAHEPDAQTLQKVMQDVDTIHKKFLKNIAKQTSQGTKMCVAVPAWHTKSHVYHLNTLENLSDLGYNRLSFAHASNMELIYHRPDQIVGRELVILVRK